jgi:hypothetical protein
LLKHVAARLANRPLQLTGFYATIGEPGAALEHIEYLLSTPSFFSVASLRLDPVWDPIRDDPRFVALLEEYSKN